jgi:hypothetical protein
MKRISLLAITLSLLLVPAFSFAQSNPYTSGVSNPIVNNPTGGSQTVSNPLGGINSFCGLIKAILTAVIQIGIPIAVLFIVYAGFKFVLARGNPTKLQEARMGLLYTLIGIGIFLGAWLIAMVIANTVNALGAGSGQNTIISCR